MSANSGPPRDQAFSNAVVQDNIVVGKASVAQIEANALNAKTALITEQIRVQNSTIALEDSIIRTDGIIFENAETGQRTTLSNQGNLRFTQPSSLGEGGIDATEGNVISSYSNQELQFSNEATGMSTQLTNDGCSLDFRDQSNNLTSIGMENLQAQSTYNIFTSSSSSAKQIQLSDTGINFNSGVDGVTWTKVEGEQWNITHDVTANGNSGRIKTAIATTPAGGEDRFTVFNDHCKSSSIVYLRLQKYVQLLPPPNGNPNIEVDDISNGQFTVVIQNWSTTSALNGLLTISFMIF
jgi:hypothetical protein